MRASEPAGEILSGAKDLYEMLITDLLPESIRLF
jgi:hypothetical protein